MKKTILFLSLSSLFLSAEVQNEAWEDLVQNIESGTYNSHRSTTPEVVNIHDLPDAVVMNVQEGRDIRDLPNATVYTPKETIKSNVKTIDDIKRDIANNKVKSIQEIPVAKHTPTLTHSTPTLGGSNGTGVSSKNSMISMLLSDIKTKSAALFNGFSFTNLPMIGAGLGLLWLLSYLLLHRSFKKRLKKQKEDFDHRLSYASTNSIYKINLQSGLIRERYIQEKESTLLDKTLTKGEKGRKLLNLEYEQNSVIHFSLPKLFSTNASIVADAARDLTKNNLIKDIVVDFLKENISTDKYKSGDVSVLKQILVESNRRENRKDITIENGDSYLIG
jgi:hypothetical protein